MPPPIALTKEERQRRIIESRQKYGRPVARPPRRSRSLEAINLPPRASIAPNKPLHVPSTKPPTRVVPFKFSSKEKKQPSRPDDEFRVDPKSMAMIESGNVIIPSQSRPSLYNRPRNTIGANVLQASRFRSSMAPVEPRVSLLPLGINILSATAAQRAQVDTWMKQKCEAATPARQKTGTAGSNSVQKVRFQESPGHDSDEKSAETARLPAVGTPFVSKFDKNGSFMPPTAMRSALKMNRMNVGAGLQATPIPVVRKLNFDEVTLEDSSMSSTVDKENSTNNSSIGGHSTASFSENVVQECFRFIQKLTQLDRDLSPDEARIVDECFDLLKNLRTRIKIGGAKEGKTQTARATQLLVPISENEDDEEEEEEVDVVAFGTLRIGGKSPPPSTSLSFGLLGPIME